MRKPLLVASIFSLLLFVTVGVFGFTQTDLDWMKEQGLTKYSTMEDFGPLRKITRGEASKFVVAYAKAIGFVNTGNGCSFSDIRGYDSTLEITILEACDYGLIKGHNGLYYPRKNLTEAEALTIAMRTIKGTLDETKNPWYKDYYDLGKEYGLLTSETVSSLGNTYITREKFGKRLVTLGRLHKAKYFEIEQNSNSNTPTAPTENSNTINGNTATIPVTNNQSNTVYSKETNTITFITTTGTTSNSSSSTNTSTANASTTTPSQSSTNTTTTQGLSLGIETMSVDERFGIGLKDKEGIDFYSMRIRPIVQGGTPKNMVIQTSVSSKHCLDFPKLNLPENFTYIRTEGTSQWKKLSSISRKTSAVSRNPVLCGAFDVKVVYPLDWNIFERGLGFSFLERTASAGTCQEFLISADNADYVEETICYKQ